MGNVQLAMGAMSDDLKVQVEAQGLSIDDKAAVFHQKDADAITRLVIRGLIPPSTADSARKRLMKAIARDIKPVSNGGSTDGE